MSFQMDRLSDDSLEFALKGDLDIYSSPHFKTQLLKEYNQDEQDILLDFSQLDYLDSTGLGALLSVYKTTKLNDHKITIRQAKKNVKKLFYITELDDEFILED